MDVEGYISMKVVRNWLENYEYMQSGDRDPDAIPTNSGPKNYDGISGGQLNKIMLDQAIANLSPLKRSCIEAKYIEKLPTKLTLKALEISYSVYQDRIRQGIVDIHNFLNGEKADQVKIPGNHKKLISKIFDKA